MSDLLPVLEPEAAYALWAASYPPYAHNVLMQAEERAMLALLPTDLSGASILDAGCGSGRYIAHARRRGARRVIGIDLSEPMLRRAQAEVQYVTDALSPTAIGLARASLERVPISTAWADLLICGLTLGHLPELSPALRELGRVTKPGGLLLCSDFHPIGESLGWKRNFKADGRRYAVRHTAHSLELWASASREAGLEIEQSLGLRLNPADIPAGARFDPAALESPVVLALALRRAP